jgi:hypothetical protein
MNNKQRKTREAIFSTPTPKSLPWSDVESLFKALGCGVFEGDGSKVTFSRNGESVSFHRPHPQKEIRAYQVRIAREFLKKIGEMP